MIDILGLYGAVIYFCGVYIYLAIFLYKNRYTYFVEGFSWPPLRPLVGFYWGQIRGMVWPIFLIMYFVNLSKKK